MKEKQKKLTELDFWPFSALDKKRDVIVFTPCLMDDFESMKNMYDTFEPKLAVQGLPPLDPQTRSEWIYNMIAEGINIKAVLNNEVIGHGSLSPMGDGKTAEFGLFIHNKYQYRGLGIMMARVLIVSAKRTGFTKLWVCEERNNSRAANLYVKCGFIKSSKVIGELEFTLDLSTVAGELDLSDRVAYELHPSGEIIPPDYLKDQDLYPDTKSVFMFSPRYEKVVMPPEHPFDTSRARLALNMMSRYGLTNLQGVQILAPLPLDENSILAYHHPQYYYFLTMMSRGAFMPIMMEYGLGTMDNPIIPGMLEYSALAAGASVIGSDLLIGDNAVDLVFNLNGGLHHAGSRYAAGFCYINDIVLAIKFLLMKGIERILYVDIDAHHGDGVQLAFYEEPRVLNISIHESGRTLFPFNSGFENELGDGPGYGYNVNVPLSPGADDQIYRDVFHRVATPLAQAFNPQVVVACIGVDTIFSDPLSHLSLTNNVFAEICAEIKKFAPLSLYLGGGGYNTDNLARAWTLAWAAVHGVEPECDYFGQMGSMAYSSEMNTGYLRDSFPFISPIKVAEARAEAQRVVKFIEKTVFPLHGIR